MAGVSVTTVTNTTTILRNISVSPLAHQTCGCAAMQLTLGCRGQPIDYEERSAGTCGKELDRLAISPARRRLHTRAPTCARATGTTGAERETRQALQVWVITLGKSSNTFVGEQICERALEVCEGLRQLGDRAKPVA